MKKAKKQNKQRMHPWEWRKSSSQDCWATGRRQHDEDTTRENHSGDQSEEGDNVMKTLQERTTLVIRARKETTWWRHYKREPLWWSEWGRRQRDDDTTRENHSGDQSEEGDNMMKASCTTFCPPRQWPVEEDMGGSEHYITGRLAGNSKLVNIICINRHRNCATQLLGTPFAAS